MSCMSSDGCQCGDFPGASPSNTLPINDRHRRLCHEEWPATTFFITSTNPAQSGNLGGLSGADAICERLASAAGVGGRNWRAYWTSSTTGGAMVGHHNRGGINPDPVANVSWNSSHITPGCDMSSLQRVGGAGLFYCFAAK